MSSHVVCFGELLWDCLPSGKVAGGAPFNIVNRINALGTKATVISSVGDDDLGTELLDLVKSKGNTTEYIQVHSELPTSQVLIKVGPGGEPDYDIVHPVAWDDILVSQESIDLIKSSDAFIYSSLGLRDERAKEALFSQLQHAKLKICDVNLRDGHFVKETIIRMMEHADILRMNETELKMVAEWLDLSSDDVNEQIKEVFERYNYKTVIATLGGAGAVAYDGTVLYQQPVFKIDVVDTVGAGDAFLAGYVTRMLKGDDVESALKYGTALGSITASKNGGTPEISPQEIETMLFQA